MWLSYPQWGRTPRRQRYQDAGSVSVCQLNSAFNNGFVMFDCNPTRVNTTPILCPVYAKNTFLQKMYVALRQLRMIFDIFGSIFEAFFWPTKKKHLPVRYHRENGAIIWSVLLRENWVTIFLIRERSGHRTSSPFRNVLLLLSLKKKKPAIKALLFRVYSLFGWATRQLPFSACLQPLPTPQL